MNSSSGNTDQQLMVAALCSFNNKLCKDEIADQKSMAFLATLVRYGLKIEDWFNSNVLKFNSICMRPNFEIF